MFTFFRLSPILVGIEWLAERTSYKKNVLWLCRKLLNGELRVQRVQCCCVYTANVQRKYMFVYISLEELYLNLLAEMAHGSNKSRLYQSCALINIISCYPPSCRSSS